MWLQPGLVPRDALISASVRDGLRVYASRILLPDTGAVTWET